LFGPEQNLDEFHICCSTCRPAPGAVTKIAANLLNQNNLENFCGSGLQPQTGAEQRLPVALTRREFELALLLFQHLDQLVTRARIQVVLGAGDGDPPVGVVDTHIAMVRLSSGYGRKMVTA
jgi:DNA-binding response OmpR family regulator